MKAARDAGLREHAQVLAAEASDETQSRLVPLLTANEFLQHMSSQWDEALARLAELVEQR